MIVTDQAVQGPLIYQVEQVFRADPYIPDIFHISVGRCSAAAAAKYGYFVAGPGQDREHSVKVDLRPAGPGVKDASPVDHKYP